MDSKGIIDEILGDGILAFFGAPEPLEDHPGRAVACALSRSQSRDRADCRSRKSRTIRYLAETM